MTDIRLDEPCPACGEPFAFHVCDAGIDAVGAEWVAVQMCDAWVLARYPDAEWSRTADPTTGRCGFCRAGYADHWEQRSPVVRAAGRRRAVRVRAGNAAGPVEVRLPVRFVGCPVDLEFLDAEQTE